MTQTSTDPAADLKNVGQSWTPTPGTEQLGGGMQRGDVIDEEWREYEWTDPASQPAGKRVTYRIATPKEVYFRKGGGTHRVVDQAGVVHCVPAVGMYGCVLRWKSKPGTPPVKW